MIVGAPLDATAVTTPPLTVAKVGYWLAQVPPVVVEVSVPTLPTQIVVAPTSAAGEGLTVTVFVTAHPLPKV